MHEKRFWDEKDFESMSWHDNRVHAIAFSPENYEFALDIDYIAEWFEPAKGENHFTFSVAPASMYFENASSIEIDVKIDSIYALFISEIKQNHIRRSPNKMYELWKYEIEFHHTGSITLEATGFKLFLRQRPLRSGAQQFSVEERGGISFGREMITT